MTKIQREGTPAPLPERMRPTDLDEIAGQDHLLSAGKPLHHMLQRGALHSMLFWGPPGSGKTTLARVIANHSDSHFIGISAVLCGIKNIRDAVATARDVRQRTNRDTILFVDEVHRFNKTQQDAFLPHVEDGTIIFIGATTENPSFALNDALLSRARVYQLKSLPVEALRQVIDRALTDAQAGVAALRLTVSDTVRERIAEAADGDARRALSILETAATMAGTGGLVQATWIDEIICSQPRRFDKYGDAFYDQISALHKSIRGSSPDAGLYWLARMLDGGCDTAYLARRLTRIASEDIGNADPRALQVALDAWNAFERLGSPEGELALAQAAVYLACAPKSNAVYQGYREAAADVEEYGSKPVPIHLRNAPTTLMRTLGFGRDYRYAHDEEHGYAAGESYLPEDVPARQYYRPTHRGLEKKISEKLAYLRGLDAKSAEQEKKRPAARDVQSDDGSHKHQRRRT